MGEIQQLYYLPPPPLPTPAAPPPPPTSSDDPDPDPAPALPPPSSSSGNDTPHPPTPPRFDPSRMIGIIRRKALIKDLAAVYHAECLGYCQELLELQRKSEECLQQPYLDLKMPENVRKETARPPKKAKKMR